MAHSIAHRYIDGNRLIFVYFFDVTVNRKLKPDCLSMDMACRMRVERSGRNPNRMASLDMDLAYLESSFCIDT